MWREEQPGGVGRPADVDEALPRAGRPAALLVDVRVGHEEVGRSGGPGLEARRHPVGVRSNGLPPAALVEAHAEDQDRAVHPLQGSGARGRTRHGSPELAQLDEEQIRPRPLAGRRDQRIDCSLGQLVEQDAVRVHRGRRQRIELEVYDGGCRTLVEGVDLRTEGPQRRKHPRRRLASRKHDGVDDHELPPPDVGREPRFVRRLKESGDAGDTVRRGGGPRTPGSQHPLGVGPVPGELPGIRGAHRKQVELERGDDTEPSATTACGPEEVTVDLVGRTDERAVRQDQLDGRDRTALKAVLTRVPAQSAAERRPHDADPGARRVQRREVDPTGSLHHVAPEHSSTDPCSAPGAVDAQLGHGRRPQQDGVTEVAGQRGGAVAGALRCDLQAGGCRRPHHRGDLIGGGRIGHGSGMGVGLEVPGQARLVVRRVPGQVHRTPAEAAQKLRS